MYENQYKNRVLSLLSLFIGTLIVAYVFNSEDTLLIPFAGKLTLVNILACTLLGILVYAVTVCIRKMTKLEFAYSAAYQNDEVIPIKHVITWSILEEVTYRLVFTISVAILIAQPSKSFLWWLLPIGAFALITFRNYRGTLWSYFLGYAIAFLLSYVIDADSVSALRISICVVSVCFAISHPLYTMFGKLFLFAEALMLSTLTFIFPGNIVYACLVHVVMNVLAVTLNKRLE